MEPDRRHFTRYGWSWLYVETAAPLHVRQEWRALLLTCLISVTLTMAMLTTVVAAAGGLWELPGSLLGVCVVVWLNWLRHRARRRVGPVRERSRLTRHEQAQVAELEQQVIGGLPAASPGRMLYVRAHIGWRKDPGQTG